MASSSSAATISEVNKFQKWYAVADRGGGWNLGVGVSYCETVTADHWSKEATKKLPVSNNYFKVGFYHKIVCKS